ncbi:hypothetical protein CLU81_4194 [Flavobacterium sp. 9]|uniref:hypothetical protein n=1 Tax=Flavobacterium sp. 9 TaxID=2035198 RepID=UPI000C199B26|nr:hypothetical protein [Flavobacterium sp. 9]PIF33577.1 hypothetical protein CLU81_4194 [Flavobacterium sp. 9]
MRKISFYLLLTFIITGCDNKEDLTSKKQALNNPMQLYIINGDIKYYSEITDGSKPKKPIFIYDIPNKATEFKNSVFKTQGNSVTINFNYGITDYPNSGCMDERYDGNTGKNNIVGVYGPNPVNRNGFLVRGYGKPYHNSYYNSLVLKASNKGIKREEIRTGRIISSNLSTISAISIEYPFKANISYEVSVKTFFTDNHKLIYNVHGNGFPTLSAALQDSGILFGGITTCEDSYRQIGVTENYMKSYTLEDNILKERTITYKFSPTEVKKALSFTLIPHTGGRGVDVSIPTNGYTMQLRSVTITEKPFDPSLNVISPRPPGR